MTPRVHERSNWPGYVVGLVLLVAGGVWCWSARSVPSDDLAVALAYTQGVARAPLLLDGLGAMDPVGTCAWLADLGEDWALLDARGIDLCSGQDRSDDERVYQAISSDASVAVRVGERVQVLIPVRDAGLTVGFLLGVR